MGLDFKPCFPLSFWLLESKAPSEKESGEQGMENIEETQVQVIDYLAKIVGSKPHLDDSLAMIGIDSVAMAELTFDLEKRFSIKIDDEILDVQTVGQLVQYLHERKS